MREVDSLRKETTFIGFYYLSVSEMPWSVDFCNVWSWGIKPSADILALPFRPFNSNVSQLSFLLFMGVSHFNYPRMPVMLPSS